LIARLSAAAAFTDPVAAAVFVVATRAAFSAVSIPSGGVPTQLQGLKVNSLLYVDSL